MRSEAIAIRGVRGRQTPLARRAGRRPKGGHTSSPPFGCRAKPRRRAPNAAPLLKPRWVGLGGTCAAWARRRAWAGLDDVWTSISKRVKAARTALLALLWFCDSADLAQVWLIRVVKLKVAPWGLEADGRPAIYCGALPLRLQKEGAFFPTFGDEERLAFFLAPKGFGLLVADGSARLTGGWPTRGRPAEGGA